MLPAWRHQWHHHAGNRRSLWLLLAVLLFCWSALQFTWANLSPSGQMLNLMDWFGCLIALEDQLPAHWPLPSHL